MSDTPVRHTHLGLCGGRWLQLYRSADDTAALADLVPDHTDLCPSSPVSWGNEPVTTGELWMLTAVTPKGCGTPLTPGSVGTFAVGPEQDEPMPALQLPSTRAAVEPSSLSPRRACVRPAASSVTLDAVAPAAFEFSFCLSASPRGRRPGADDTAAYASAAQRAAAMAPVLLRHTSSGVGPTSSNPFDVDVDICAF